MALKLKVEIRAEVRNRQGRIIRRYPWRPSSSLLKQWIQCIKIQLSQVAETVTLVTGGTSSVGLSSDALRVDGPAADTVKGILIGTGTNPVTMTDYKLQTQVTTNITHGSTNVVVENPSASSWRVVISRSFTNGTGALLTIREVALYNKIGVVAAAICFDRSLYTVSVAAGSSVTLYYRITATL